MTLFDMEVEGKKHLPDRGGKKRVPGGPHEEPVHPIFQFGSN